MVFISIAIELRRDAARSGGGKRENLHYLFCLVYLKIKARRRVTNVRAYFIYIQCVQIIK